jgi:hypothetical protein
MEKKQGSVKRMIIKDSGERQSFTTGSRRDVNKTKVRPDLLPCTCEFMEGAHFAMGAVKYDQRNWELGQPIMRLYECLKRHLLLWAMGDVTENHLNGVRWNAMAIQHTLIMIDYGHLPKELDDRPEYMKPDNQIGKDMIGHFMTDITELVKRNEEQNAARGKEGKGGKPTF